MMRRLLLPATIAGLTAACTPSDPKSPGVGPRALGAQSARAADPHAAHKRTANNGELTPEQKKAIAEVRNATTRFHDLATAKQAGYTAQYPKGCAESSEGAQAFHFLNEGLVDDKVELLKPELVMYEPQPNGTLQLIGVDYVVPFDKWTSSEPPTLLGVPFMRNEPLGVWALHIWAWRPNPSGMFAAWNPKVSCQHASKVPASLLE